MTVHVQIEATVQAALRVGVGVSSYQDTIWAAVRATAMARAGLGGATPDLVLLVTAGPPSTDVVPMIRSVLGPVGIAGGAVAAILSDGGVKREGALVVSITNGEGAASGVAAAGGRDLADASQAAARLILSGWPFRMRYPRGLGLAFGLPGFGSPAASFLQSWRLLMGPKMRTVCSIASQPVLYGNTSDRTLASAACLEASYATGLGWADGFAGEEPPAPEALIASSVDATRAALGRLRGEPVRLVLVVESAARHLALGAAAAEEWAAIRMEMDRHVPCVGWVCEEVSAYGRGVRPVDAHGALVVVALGDAPRR